jgi:hypothetical protein
MTKVIHELMHVPSHPHSIPKRPWEKISVDLIGPLPMSNNKDMIMVVVDWLTKAMVAFLTNSNVTTDRVAWLFRDHIWSKYGLLEVVISDQRLQFVSQFMRALMKLLWIKENPSTAYHLQTDRQTERHNQEIKQYLQIYIKYQQDDWAKWLMLAEFTYNDWEHAATKCSPFFANYGAHPQKGTKQHIAVKSQSAIKLAKQMQRIHKEVGAAIAHAQQLTKRQYDKGQKYS